MLSFKGRKNILIVTPVHLPCRAYLFLMDMGLAMDEISGCPGLVLVRLGQNEGNSWMQWPSENMERAHDCMIFHPLVRVAVASHHSRASEMICFIIFSLIRECS
jgi:hypothetical protein